MIVMLPFSIFCAAVFAEPSVPEIEEVIGLVHKSRGLVVDWWLPINSITPGTLSPCFLIEE